MGIDYAEHRKHVPGLNGNGPKIRLSSLTAGLDAQRRETRRSDGSDAASSASTPSARERELEKRIAALERELDELRNHNNNMQQVIANALAADRMAQQKAEAAQRKIDERCKRVMDRWRNVSVAMNAVANADRYGDIPASIPIVHCVGRDWWDDTLPVCLLYSDPEYRLWDGSFECFQLLWDHGECEFLKEQYPEYAEQYEENKSRHRKERQEQLDWCHKHLPEPFKSRLPSHI